MIDFDPHPEIAYPEAEYADGTVVACNYDPLIHRATYRYNYKAIFDDIADGALGMKDAWRWLVLNDLFFIVLFVMEIEKSNHPFVVNMCNMVQDGPKTNTLDIWARGHWKSTVITQAETIQYQLTNPEHCTGIFAYSRPAAKKFLRGIKGLLETSKVLKFAFPDVLYDKPEAQSPKWSEDDGLVLRRKSAARGESSIEAWGLTEGMPTGRHFERRVFDDLETEDIRESPDMLDKVYSKFTMAGNLGTMSDKDVERVIGTYYSHFGPNVKIGKLEYADKRKVYESRIIPGSDNGQRDGNPVFMDLNSWEKAKTSIHFNSQQLCDPTPSSEIRLDFKLLKPIEPQFVPRNVYKFMVLDQAGGDETAKQSRDLWSYGVVGVEPCMDEIGQSKVYLLDLEADKMSHSEGIDGLVRMYLRNGIIHQVGVEKVGLSTTEIHITNALRASGRRISLESGNLVLLKPGGRSKEFRVESALQWPLNNGMLYYSTAIHSRYIQAIEEEMQKFPYFHIDILDMWAYVYDLIKHFRFVDSRDQGLYVIQPESYVGQSAITGY